MACLPTILAAGLLLAATVSAALPPAAAEALQRGSHALSDRLPDIAAARFQEALATPGLSDGDQQRLLLLLADALIRSNNWTEALETLNNPLLEESGEAVFWRGQALAGLGQFSQAVSILDPLAADPAEPFHEEASFTSASLLLALGDPVIARKTLMPLLESPDADTQRRARLLLAEITFDQGDFGNAREQLDMIKEAGNRLGPRLRFLDASLLIEEGKPDQAVERFALLASQPHELHERSILGLAAAQAAAAQPDDAADVLIRFISERPQSPLLGDAFDQFVSLLPEQPTANDPILEQISNWLPPPHAGIRPIILADDGAASACPRPDDPTNANLHALALYHLAHSLRRTGDPIDQARAFQLLRQLRVGFPTHALANRALLDAGRWHLADDRLPPARSNLAALSTIAKDARLAAVAGFLAATGEARAGNHEAAAKTFDLAAESLDGAAAESAAINAGVTRLLAGDELPGPDPDTDPRSRIAIELALERALVHAAAGNPSARPELDRFIIENPDHPRLAEARLALATAAMTGESPDLALAKAQLDTLVRNPGSRPVDAGALARARTRLAELREDWTATATIAGEFLAEKPDHPATPDLALQLGRALFRQGDFNQARLALERLAEANPTAPAAEVALFLAARSAALGATSQARTESIDLYQQVIRINGTLADSARLEKARTMVDMGRFDDAITDLREWLRSLDPDSRLGFAAGTLLAEAWFAKGGNDSAAYEEALTVYRDLADRSAPESAMNHRSRYLLGLTLERLEEPGKALDIYYSLLESASRNPPLEWEWVERAGFRALSLLESAERWPAATAIATRIAKLDGPRAAEAAARARKLRLEHMIWDE